MAFQELRSFSMRQRLQLCSFGVVAVGLAGGWLVQVGLLRLQDPLANTWRGLSPAVAAIQQVSSEPIAERSRWRNGESDQLRILQAIVDQSSSPGQMIVVSGPERTLIVPSAQALLRFDTALQPQQLRNLPWLQSQKLESTRLFQPYRHQLVTIGASDLSVHLIAKAPPSPRYDSPLLWVALASGLVAVMAVIEACVRPLDRLAVLISRIDADAVASSNPSFPNAKRFPIELNGVVAAVNRILEKFIMLHEMVPGRLKPVALQAPTRVRNSQDDVVVIGEWPASSRRSSSARPSQDAEEASRVA